MNYNKIKDVIGVIPARFSSTRFPGKPLIDLCGLPMVIRVAKKLEKAIGIQNTYIATDHENIKKIANDYGYKVIMTSTSALTGTDRIYEASNQIKSNIFINVQGDEPLINPKDIISVIEKKSELPNSIINCYSSIESEEEKRSLNVPKVIFDDRNYLIYMSRSPIPCPKNNDFSDVSMYKQVCIYAYNQHELQEFGKSEKTYFETIEDIEILRFIELGFKVKMVESKYNKFSLSVDTPDDADKVRSLISATND